ncbi:unnamed protein product [Phaedon cochleariae]|uniref:SAM domain-containing protein n=1 Tax=Phaedon cochleariae TaxID=80249 RepID=A0A9P0GLS6_PHACE|nr:unnamed protein product [Phaedon cochleariae]
MTTNRFHKAAKDGIIEVLKETTKRDCNVRDEQGMTPTLYAAFYGNLDALRVLCGRGGDPDKADLFGNTALHLAAAQGHKHVVTFLVNFGANIYATDVDGRTAQELAGINNREDILRFIDGVHAKLEASDKKKARAMQERAKEDAKKRVKEFNKRLAKKEQMHEKLERRKSKDYRPSMIETLKSRIIGGSMTNLANDQPTDRRNTYSAIISGGTAGKGSMSTVQRRILASKNNRLGQTDDDFKISGIEDGKLTVNSIKGIRRNSEVLYGGTLEGSTFKERGRLEGIFNEAEYIDDSPTPPPSQGLTRSKSQPDFMQELRNNPNNKLHQEPPSIFIRPGMGSIVIRKSITNNTFGRYYRNQEESSIGSGESYGPRQTTDDELSDSDSSEENDPNAPLERFLTAFGLSEYASIFVDQKIDLETLMVLEEGDLRRLNLPVGPHRLLVIAINERKAALDNPGEVKDSML